MALGNTPISSALLAGRRSGNLFVKQQPSDAFPTIASAWVWGTAVSGAYTLTAQGGSYSIVGASATIDRTYIKPYLISSTALALGTSATPGAQTITVPEDAQLVVVHATSYTSGGLTLSISSNFSGSFTTTTAGDGSDKCHISYAIVSSTGSKTITPVWSSDVTDGPIFIVSFIKNVDTGNFLRAVLAQNLNTQGNTLSTSIASNTTDLVLALERESLTTTPPTTLTGFTSIVTSGINNIGSRLQSCNSPGASTTSLSGSGTDFPGFAAISIKQIPSGAYILTASGGVYNLGGSIANIKCSKYILANGGAYSINGSNATIGRNRTLNAQGGVYTYTGQSVTITYVAGSVNYTLTALGGTYTLIGASALVSRNRLLISSGGSYTYNGSSANLLRSKYLLSSGGSYSYTGSSASLLRSKYLSATGGVYSITGATANIFKSKRLVASSGSYVYTGNTITLKRSKYLNVSGGSYSLVGSSANITWGSVGGAVWPPVHLVLLGTIYGPTGIEYTGTLDVNGIKYDITTGQLVKPINDKVVMSI